MRYQYKSTDSHWLEKVPKHWLIDRIKDKTENVTNGDWGDDPESDAEGENITVFRAADIDSIYVSFDNLTSRKIKSSSYESRKITKKSLIIEKSGGGEKQIVGRVALPKNINFKAITSNFMAKIDFDNSVDIRFANYVFNTLYNSKLNFPFVQQTTGIQNLNLNYYLTTKVSFPPLEEQITIADYLDETCERIDKIIEIKKKQIKTSDGFFKSKLYEVLTKGIGKNDTFETDIDWLKFIPKGWEIVRLKSVVTKINSGVTPKGGATSYVENGVPLIRSQNIKFNSLDLSDVVFISNKVHNKMKNSKVQNGDVLLNITGASLGRCYFVENLEEANVNQHVCIIRPFQKIKTKFLYYLFLSEIGQGQIFSGFKGSGREGLNFESIKNFKFPLPPISEQEEIIKKLDIIVSLFTKQRSKIKSQIKTLQAYKKSIIHECVTGKKQVFDGTIKL